MKKPSVIQTQAITHIRGPAFVIAGPGSGKTFVIIQRIYHLISKEHVKPDNILVLTFSKAAANEMNTRFTGAYNIYGVNFGTIHAFSYSVLREYFGGSSLRLITESDKRKLLGVIMANHGLSQQCNADVTNEILGFVSRKKNNPSGIFQNGFLNSTLPEESVKEIISEYERYFENEGYIDFDDMVIKCLRYLECNDEAKRRLKERIKYIIIDEFQDTNPVQYELLRILENDDHNIMAVGDDDQSIYGFRGSEPNIMNRFLAEHPDSKVIKMGENYRSGKNIVEFAAKIIKHNKNRFPKAFIPVNDEGNVVIKITDTHRMEEELLSQMIKKTLKEDEGSVAVILRTNNSVGFFAGMLEKNDIYVRKNRKSAARLKDCKVTKDFEAFLKYLYGGEKRSDFICFMNKPVKYIQREALLSETVDFEELYRFYQRNDKMIITLKSFHKKILLAQKTGIRCAVSIFRKQIGYDAYLKENAKSRQELELWMSEADELEERLKNINGHIGLSEIWDDIANDSKERTESRQNNDEPSDNAAVTVITMHQSKGLEFDHVFLPDINEGVIPSKKSDEKEIEEECRLLYVAATRAKRSLTIMATRERNRDISRFIDLDMAKDISG